MASKTGQLAGRTIFISGASRGIGQAIALRCARDGANIVVAAKTAEPHPKLPGTIYTAAKQIEEAGGGSLACVVDIRDEAQVRRALEQAADRFGGVDILINNASAISLTGTDDTSMKKYDLMHQINARGTYLCSKLALPYLRKSANPHILNISPPLNMNPRWFKNHVAYTMAKYGMSMCVLGMAEELRDEGIAVNALWPRTAIWTAAMAMLGGGEAARKQCRTDQIMADAAYVMLTRPAREYTANFAIDDEVLAEAGVTDLDKYACEPGAKLLPDFFLDGEDPDALRQQFQNEGARPLFGHGSSGTASSTGTAGVFAVFQKLQPFLTEDACKHMGAVFQFNLSGVDPGTWHLDLQHGSGAAGEGEPAAGRADATFTMSAEDFAAMFRGELNATMAFMSGRVKIAGDLGKAMKLEKLMKDMRAKL